VAYQGAQASGNLNIVIVGWSDATSQITSVTDQTGNSYQLAAGPTLVTGSTPFSQSIYYSPGIKPGSNAVTVKFSDAVNYPDIRVLEYSGVATANPVDVTGAFSSGNDFDSTLPSWTNTVTTTYAPDLLVAGNTVMGTTTGPGTNFTQRLLTSPDSNLAEDRIVTAPGLYSASSGSILGSSAWVMQMVAFRGAASQPPDTTPPTVSIKPPASGTGTITVTVNASDTGTGVAGVQLQVDGIPFGTAAIASPYTFSLNTAKFANGSHTLTASAWDFANNSATSSPVSVTFSNSSPANPAQSGVMSGTVPLPIVSVNSILLPNGKVLMYDGETFGGTAIIWDPAMNTTNWVPAPSNMFCTADEQLPDGRIMVVGGSVVDHQGLPAVNVFNSTTESWTVFPSMTYPRWYPTETMLQDGTVIVMSGEENGPGTDALIDEIYSPVTNSWSQLSNAPFPYSYYYPHCFLLPDGRVLLSSCTQWPIVSQVLDLKASTWTAVGGTTALDGGSATMYLPGKILKMGHYGDPDYDATASTATAYVLDMTQTTPAWQQVASMHFARTYHCSTLLPDGTVLVTGGGTDSAPADVANAVLPVELWSPTTQTWTTLASMSAPRLYHSEALLLPDGRVLISGGGRFNDDNEPTYQYSAEFFEPPYLFNGPRPVITSAPAQLSYGQNFTVQTPNAGQIAAVSLIRFGSVTHDINMSQRFLPLTFSVGTGSLNVTAPANDYLAPPGNYMLFIVNSAGVPSVAAVVHF